MAEAVLLTLKTQLQKRVKKTTTTTTTTTTATKRKRKTKPRWHLIMPALLPPGPPQPTLLPLLLPGAPLPTMWLVPLLLPPSISLQPPIGHVNVNDAHLVRFNFTARYPYIHNETPTLTDGHQIVIGVYLVPTQNVSSYYAQVTPNRMGAVFGMQIPRLFADVFTCTFSELDQFEADFAVVLSAMRETTNLIALMHDKGR
jgi:hypothetical protein